MNVRREIDKLVFIAGDDSTRGNGETGKRSMVNGQLSVVIEGTTSLDALKKCKYLR